MMTMRGQLVVGAFPGVVLFAAFLAAMLWPRPLVSEDLKFAEGVVGWLQRQGVNVQSVHRWSHGPWKDASCAATMDTGVGLVQVVVFRDERDLEQLAVVETTVAGSGSGKYRYRVSGWPDADELAWESSYRWFLTVYRNWLLVTPDAAVNGIITHMVNHQIFGVGASGANRCGNSGRAS